MASSTTWVLLKSRLDAALGFFYPEVCQLCEQERATASEGYVCCSCRRKVKPVQAPYCERCGRPFEGDITVPFECAHCRGVEWHFTQARSAVIFDGTVREVLHRYKYRRERWFEPFLTDLVTQCAPTTLPAGEWDLMVPVPLHARKEREREFNQAEYLGNHLARLCGMRMNQRLVVRSKFTQTQTRFNREERRMNVKNAFAMRPGRQLNGEQVLVVDDVMTTGATADDCARALLKHGASRVGVWTLARGV